jgi:hypothetical protein
MKRLLIQLTRNPISLLGAAITTASAVLILSLVGIELVGFPAGPYMGILAFLVLPAFFVLGLLMIPVGLFRERRAQRRAAARGEAPPSFPVLDFNRPAIRRGFLLFFAATLVNLIILATATYKGVEIMDSTAFCGRTCHSVMAPEYTAWQRSPHSRVACVSCHIGPGADWFVKSKLSGTWQVIAVTFNLYPRPIPTPIRNLRPARETCEQCHWPTKFIGDRLKVITHYDDDAANTEKKTVLLLRVGGAQGSVSRGIHWHVDPWVRVRYRSDEKRERIDEVELTRADGTVTLYRGPGAGKGEKTSEWRTMDCVDCHNRPSHIYRTPEEAIDQAIHDGLIDRSLPFVRRESLVALKRDYASHEEAVARMAAQLQTYYEKAHPDLVASRRPAIEAAGRQLGEIYARNVFPTMKIAWKYYPVHIGHQNSPGCWRCHDDEHKTADGKAIGQDCTTCHALLATDEQNPEILKQLNP